MFQKRKRTLSVLCICWFAAIALAQNASAPPASSAEIQRHIQHIESGLLPAVVCKNDAHSTYSLRDRMAAFHVPGVSVAVVHRGKMEWAKGFGAVYLGGPPVNADTLFQAGSISKPVAAMAALHLVQQGKLSLDANVNAYLTGWKVPASPAMNGKPVTLREILTHTAGFNVHGFPGYASGTPVPTLVQVLDGEKPANAPAIRVVATPGSKWMYSGGGYTVMQQLLIGVSKEPFPKLLHDTVLAPIGMTHSTYQQPLPAKLRSNAAVPYYANSKRVPGGAHTYPELAAAGLWTTPSDLARYEMENQLSLQGKANHVLSRKLTQQTMTPGLGHWGLGVEIGGSSNDPYFSHGGVNEGFESLFVAYEKNGEGAVVMTNAQGGSILASEIMRSIAAEYGWPDYRPKIVSAVRVDRHVLASYAGTYEFPQGFSIVIAEEGGKLLAQWGGMPELLLIPESETKFIPTEIDVPVEFVKNNAGKVAAMAIDAHGTKMKGLRK